jgi:hypothetical protein
MGVLITDYTAFGVKVAGIYYRVLYGTREIDTVPLTKRGNGHTRIV